MCGITGYVGERSAVSTALTNLKRLEYRGYDSAGVAFPNCTQVHVVRATGKIANLERALEGLDNSATRVAIAHTRWATHGRPSEANAHPHRDCSGRIAVVHNGIIENYAELRRELIAAGHEFLSETDTEVIAHLIEREIDSMAAAIGREALAPDQFAAAARTALRRLRGAYAIAVIAQQTPDTVFVARRDSPLVIGLGEGENFLASDIPAVMRFTRRVILLEDGDCALITRQSVVAMDMDGCLVDRAPLDITWDDAAAEKGGFDHFMLKEIHEGPRTVRDTLRGRLTDDGAVALPSLPFRPEEWRRFRRVAIVGCGTAYHAGVVAKRLFEQLLRRPVETSVASEFRYSDPLVDQETLVVLISQSGETADTLAAMREARARGATTLAIVNVVGSTLAREADASLLTQAGPEIGVASTKAYLAQLTALTLLGLYLAQIDAGAIAGAPATAQETGSAAGAVHPSGPANPSVAAADGERASALRAAIASHVNALRALPEMVEACLEREPEIAALAERLCRHSCFFFLGRGYDFAAALEAALKLKEISYIHAEAYPAGEMKHGPLALVEPGVAVVGLCTQPATAEKMASNLKEVKAREGTVIAVVREGDPVSDSADEVIAVPATLDALMPIVAMVPMQLLSYYVARARGCEIDQPRNLAKSVTVE
ncbi:MAG TPA: glutamine--fructose-6-phosphate transaminase (isomerizing) [Chthonomonadaceae bacterium]|nr:glutamine--fructose-6-phosphate transaminase (isomerizing) [Chthonomonadaceae bacterium]